MTPIKLAVQRAGGQTALADKLTALTPDDPVSQQSVWKWINRGYPPADRCIAIEMVTRMNRGDLRPDVFLPPIDQPDQCATATTDLSAT